MTYDIITAIKHDNVPLAIELITGRGLDVNLDDGFFLCRAIGYGRKNLVEWLIDNGANPNCRRGECAWLCVVNGHLELLRYLVNQGLNLLEYEEFGVCGLISEAASRGNFPIAEYLLQNGISPHSPDNAAFVNAAKNLHNDLLLLLIQQATEKVSLTNDQFFKSLPNFFKSTETFRILLFNELITFSQVQERFTGLSIKDGNLVLIKRYFGEPETYPELIADIKDDQLIKFMLFWHFKATEAYVYDYLKTCPEQHKPIVIELVAEHL